MTAGRSLRYSRLWHEVLLDSVRSPTESEIKLCMEDNLCLRGDV